MSVPGLFAAAATRSDATLFLGTAMAITAFPMLARIIEERGLSPTSIGTLALSAGAIDGAVAWCVLAVVLASFDAAYLSIGGGLAIAAFMIFAMPRLLAPLARAGEAETAAGKPLGGTPLAIVMTLFMASAFAADRIGLHAVLGGFLLGCAMPRGALGERVRDRLEPFTVVVLLPLYFTHAALNTKLSFVADRVCGRSRSP